LLRIEHGKTYPSKEIFEKFCDLASKTKDSYWYKEDEFIPFASLKSNKFEINSVEIEKLCTNIETREYLNCLKKRYYGK
jgi:hypothetical protein